jgi:hypothetical protein
MAAALCRRAGVMPRDLLAVPRMAELQRALLRGGQFIPGVALEDADDLARQAELTASSELKLAELTPSGATLQLTASWAMMLPVPPGPMPQVEFRLDVAAPTQTPPPDSGIDTFEF